LANLQNFVLITEGGENEELDPQFSLSNPKYNYFYFDFFLGRFG
jgi:hypothetical protein